MARYRETPRCSFCGAPIAKATYLDQSDVPRMMRIIGDTFLGWEDIPHTCEGLEKWASQPKENVDLHLFNPLLPNSDKEPGNEQ